MKDDKRLKRKVRNSYIVSTVSITLVLFLLGSVGYLMVAALKVADTLQESIAVTVELKNGLSEAQKETISKRLTAEEMVATIAYSAKEEKAEEEEFRKMFGSSFEEILPENPLLDSFELTLTSASSDKELLDSFIAAAGRIEGVDRVSYPALMAERLHATVNKIRLVLLLFGGAMANARYVSKSVDGWCAGVEAALAAAEAEDWEGAREVLGAVYASWDARQTYFHIMVEHAELDAAEALFAVSHSFAESEDGAEFRANTAELLTQLRLLDEMEEISIKNIL